MEFRICFFIKCLIKLIKLLCRNWRAEFSDILLVIREYNSSEFATFKSKNKPNQHVDFVNRISQQIYSLENNRQFSSEKLAYVLLCLLFRIRFKWDGSYINRIKVAPKNRENGKNNDKWIKIQSENML